MPHNTAIHPEGLKKVVTVRAGEQARIDFVAGLTLDVDKALADRETWESHLDRWFRKRYGLRPSSVSFPWPGASNVHVFLTEEKIRRLKPNYINLALEGDPIVTMFPVGRTPLESAQTAEIFMDWVLKYYMNRVPGVNYIESLTLIVDWMLERGFSFGKVVWEYLTRPYERLVDLEDLPDNLRLIITDPATADEELAELISGETGLLLDEEDDKRQIDQAIQDFREGKTTVKFTLEETVYDGPRVIPVPPEDLIVPADTTDLETARLLCHRMFLTLNELKQAERNGKYQHVDDLETKPQTRSADRGSLLKNSRASREGLAHYMKLQHLIEIWEVFTWYDLNGDGVDEKVVITFEPESQTILRFIAFPYDHGKWPFVKFTFELTDVRWYSHRGVPELLDHYQTIATNQENAKLNYLAMANSLNFKYRVGSVNYPNFRFIPGEGLPVQRMDDLEQLRVDRIDISFDQEMAKVRGLADQLIGPPDFMLDTLARPAERRTKFEVAEATGLSRQVFSLDARLFKNSLQKLYGQIYDLWLQYGPDELYVAVTGGNPVQVTREQLRNDLVIVPNGEFTLLSRTLEQQRAFAILELAIGDQSGATNPYEAWRNYLLKVDPKASQRILNTPEMFQRIQQLRLQAAEQEFARKAVIAGRTGNGQSQVRRGVGESAAMTEGP